MTEFSRTNQDETDADWAELLVPEYKPSRHRWFAWYPVPCHDITGEHDIGWVWLNVVEYEIWQGKYYYFFGDYDDYT